MKRSARISLHLVPLVSAAFLAACEQTPERRACADWQGQVVDDANCPPEGGPRSYTPTGGGPFYRWYWYRSYYPIYIGQPVPVGGSYAGPTLRGGGGRASGTVRGGFGSTAAGHGTGTAG